MPSINFMRPAFALGFVAEGGGAMMDVYWPSGAWIWRPVLMSVGLVLLAYWFWTDAGIREKLNLKNGASRRLFGLLTYLLAMAPLYWFLFSQWRLAGIEMNDRLILATATILLVTGSGFLAWYLVRVGERRIDATFVSEERPMNHQSSSGDASPNISGNSNNVTINVNKGVAQPKIEGLTLVKTPIASRFNDAPYAIEITIQFASEVGELGIGFRCDTEIAKHRFRPAMGGTFQGNARDGQIPGVPNPQNTFFFWFRGTHAPPLGPRNPLVLQLYATQPFDVIEAMRLD